MASQRPPSHTRERILDAATEVMRRDGLARATTRHIARAAGCSEALLYRYFPDKQELFLRVLAERSARLDIVPALVGVATVTENLAVLTERLLEFYAANFAMSASMFGDVDLLNAHRQAMQERGAGPQAPVAAIEDYLRQEAAIGRVDPARADVRTLARLLVGAALYEAFIAAYENRKVTDPATLAHRLVAGLAL